MLRLKWVTGQKLVGCTRPVTQGFGEDASFFQKGLSLVSGVLT